MKKLQFIILALCVFCLYAARPATAKEMIDINVIQCQYFKYGLIPLTECPEVTKPNYRLWQEAYSAIVGMDRDIATDPKWQQLMVKGPSSRDTQTYMNQEIEKHQCNYLVKQFNLGEFGNRYYSIFSGPSRNGSTVWKSGAWFRYNPSNPRDIGPNKKYYGEMRFTISGSTLKGEYTMQNGGAAAFTGMLSDTKITYTITPGERGKAKEGTIDIRTPLYMFGTWIDLPGSPKEHRGEWDFTRIAGE